MIARYYEVVCDRCELGVHIMPSAAESRSCAAEEGWVRKRVDGRLVDLCSDCAAERRRGERRG